jgi:hypothetical protein
MTLGQQAIRKAEQQGVKQGIEETALRMLEKKLDVNLIADLTHLDFGQKIEFGHWRRFVNGTS